MSAIHLVTIVKTTDLSFYGMDTVLKPFVEDLKKLVSIILSYIIIH